MDFYSWFRSVNNTYVDIDGNNSPQCMDSMHSYCMKVLGLNRFILAAPTAIQSFSNSSPLFTKIINRPWNVPKQGDIIYFGKPFGLYIGDDKKLHYAGDVAIVNTANVWSLTAINQNNPLGSRVHVQAYNYRGCLGWLRRK